VIRKFEGYRGVAALLQIGDIAFLVVAKDETQLAALHAHILPEADPFNPAACQKTVVIPANLLPEAK
jgi:hypothetical protein